MSGDTLGDERSSRNVASEIVTVALIAGVVRATITGAGLKHLGFNHQLCVAKRHRAPVPSRLIKAEVLKEQARLRQSLPDVSVIWGMFMGHYLSAYNLTAKRSDVRGF
jgi:hypothetical protein